MCIAMLLFLLVQLFCFYKRGMVFSPWYNYGMYSEIIKPDSIYNINKVYADGALLQGNKYSPQEWDEIHFTLAQAAVAECNGNFYSTQIRRLFQKFHLSAPDSLLYVNTIADPRLTTPVYASWIKRSFNFHYIDIVPLRYTWNGNILSIKDTAATIITSSFLCK